MLVLLSLQQSIIEKSKLNLMHAAWGPTEGSHKKVELKKYQAQSRIFIDMMWGYNIRMEEDGNQ